ncbi:MAG: hypothetical protein ACRDQV_19035 [Pseudonocardiaceae bacterium]
MTLEEFDALFHPELADVGPDSWLFDAGTPGRPECCCESPASVTAYRRIADMVWSQAEPFEQWWAANQQFHRDFPSPYGQGR